ncbi:hypothetical protein GCM10023198_33210 [Promicromonospora umidemergens]|uniref:Uncharacterized protein n=1 Tax=Promicromonospora umidemergens TaxID=629679 RepID=A0ABP8XI12_9MICO
MLDGDKNSVFACPRSSVPARWLADVRDAGFIWFVYGGRSALERTQIMEGTYERSNAFIRLSRRWSWR